MRDERLNMIFARVHNTTKEYIINYVIIEDVLPSLP